MTRVVLGLIRLLAVSLSLCFATLAAALFLTFVLFLNADAGWLQDDPLVAGGSLVFATVVWFAAAQLALFPALIIIAVLEFGRITSLTMNLVAGGLVALSLLIIPQGEITIDASMPYTIREIWMAIIASGFVGGLAHWILAGHRAGRWLGPQKHEADRPV